MVRGWLVTIRGLPMIFPPNRCGVGEVSTLVLQILADQSDFIAGPAERKAGVEQRIGIAQPRIEGIVVALVSVPHIGEKAQLLTRPQLTGERQRVRPGDAAGDWRHLVDRRAGRCAQRHSSRR